MINVAVTSVGSGVGQSVVDSLSCYHGYRIIGLDIASECFAKSQCNDYIVTDRCSSPDYIDNIIAICLEKNVDILISGNDNELELFSNNVDKFEENSIQVVISPIEIVKSSRNKEDWADYLGQDLNIVPTANLKLFLEGSQNGITFPAIIKPSGGSASSGIYIVHDLVDLKNTFISETINANEYVIQPYLFPEISEPEYEILKDAVSQKRLLQISEISIQLVYSKLSELLGTFISKNKLKNGVPVHVEPIQDAYISGVVKDIAERLKKYGVKGPVNIQGRMTEQGLVFFEMNLRFTGITGNRALFGFNEVKAVVDSYVIPDSFKNQLEINYNKIGVRQVACRVIEKRKTLNGKKVLVLGASSWFARNFIEYFANNRDYEQWEFICSSRQKCEYGEYPNVRSVSSEGGELESLAKYSDVVVNFASARPPHGNNAIYDSTIYNLRIVDILRNCSNAIVLNISSQSVYNIENDVSFEDSSIDIDSYYAFSKAIVEDSFVNLGKLNRSSKVLNLRLGRLWGGVCNVADKQLPERIKNELLGITNDEIIIETPKDVMNFLDVSDAVRAIELIILKEPEKLKHYFPESTLNLGGHNISLESFIKCAYQASIALGVNVNKIKVNRNSDHNLKSLSLNSDLLIKAFNFELTPVEVTWRKYLL